MFISFWNQPSLVNPAEYSIIKPHSLLVKLSNPAEEIAISWDFIVILNYISRGGYIKRESSLYYTCIMSFKGACRQQHETNSIKCLRVLRLHPHRSAWYISMFHSVTDAPKTAAFLRYPSFAYKSDRLQFSALRGYWRTLYPTRLNPQPISASYGPIAVETETVTPHPSFLLCIPQFLSVWQRLKYNYDIVPSFSFLLVRCHSECLSFAIEEDHWFARPSRARVQIT